MGAGLGLPRTVAPAGDTKGPRRSSKSGVQVSRHYFCRKWKRFRLGRGIHTLSTPESARRSYARPHAARSPSPSAGPKSTRHRRRGAGSTRTGARAPTPVALGPASSPAFPQGLPAQDTRAHPAGQTPSKSRTEASAAKWNDMQMQADVSTQQGQAERGRRAQVHGAPGAHLAWPLPPAPPTTAGPRRVRGAPGRAPRVRCRQEGSSRARVSPRRPQWERVLRPGLVPPRTRPLRARGNLHAGPLRLREGNPVTQAVEPGPNPQPPRPPMRRVSLPATGTEGRVGADTLTVETDRRSRPCPSVYKRGCRQRPATPRKTLPRTGSLHPDPTPVPHIWQLCDSPD